MGKNRYRQHWKKIKDETKYESCKQNWMGGIFIAREITNNVIIEFKYDNPKTMIQVELLDSIWKKYNQPSWIHLLIDWSKNTSLGLQGFSPIYLGMDPRRFGWTLHDLM